ncbi:MAG TPA: L,D-transpeptidase [Myxococcota bacterium]|nr:L,D-transpeptidase [Myxococcota bacterium]HRY95480.1 L,D-transpeptidase [Myxococcota bacterium]HSA24311.1 L,D-transpeptidase [Myxococcota bacterium]
MRKLIPWMLVLALAGCAEEEGTDVPGEGEDLGLGELSSEDDKEDGMWGAATTCKAIPDLPPLSSPRIIVSLHGLTLRLVDEAAGYDKVFPIGPGAIDSSPSSLTYQESLSMYPLLRYDTQDFELRPATITACKIWWRDPATGKRLPVFAGLPFLSWSGNYGMHGPIDNYRAANGGTLRRGFVSHGCLRMEAADVLEVYARIRGVARVPVRVSREPERDADGVRVDVPGRWFGSECRADADCDFQNGFCLDNPVGGRGYCAQACSRTCPDKAGYPVSFCVADPGAPERGVCALKEQAENRGCRPGDHLVPTARTRFNEPAVSATVCLPGSRGWIGDRCLADGDCLDGTSCVPVDGAGGVGMCTQGCTSSCPDQPGRPWTACVEEPALGGDTCLRQCTPDDQGAECPEGFLCEDRPRADPSRPAVDACVPL